MEMDSLIEQIKEFGTGIRDMNDPFFDEGNEVCRMYTKSGIVDEDDESLCHEQLKYFSCDIPNCNAEFDNLLTFDLHYNSCHRFSCAECKKQFISPHLLDLHLSETHDSFFKVQAERKPMYHCFVESCDIVSVDENTRKRHCIDVHHFPHDFKFGLSKKYSKPKKPKQKKLPKDGDDVMEVTSKISTEVENKMEISSKTPNKKKSKNGERTKEVVQFTPNNERAIATENGMEVSSSNRDDSENTMEVAGNIKKPKQNKVVKSITAKEEMPNGDDNPGASPRKSPNHVKPVLLTSFTFGRKKMGKTFMTNKPGQSVTNIEMKELMDSLPS